MYRALGMKRDGEYLVEPCICAKYTRVPSHVARNLVTEGDVDSDLRVRAKIVDVTRIAAGGNESMRIS